MVEFIAMTLLMGLLLVVVVAALPRLSSRRGRYFSSPPGSDTTDSADLFTRVISAISSVVRNPSMWLLGFVLLAFGLTGVVLILVSAPDIPEDFIHTLIIGLGAFLALLFVLYLFIGTYLSIKARGRHTAEATLVGLGVLGTLFMIAVLVVLVVG